MTPNTHLDEAPPGTLRTVFFLSDYGTRDEFVGVVHAVLTATCPGLTIIDLTHQIPPFDIRAGAHALVRAMPHLGPGVILAVVDPEVGSTRRGLCIEVDSPDGTRRYFVGPDNGLLVAAAEVAGEAPIARVFELNRDQAPDVPSGTFAGRDLFAPTAAALCRGVSPPDLGDPIDPHSLVRLFRGVVEHGRFRDGRTSVRAEVTWVDHFGNVQLAATLADAHVAGIPLTGEVSIMARADGDAGGPVSATDPALAITLRCVETFADLGRGELGLLIDSNGHLAVVAGQASAAHWLDVGAGELVVLAW